MITIAFKMGTRQFKIGEVLALRVVGAVDSYEPRSGVYWAEKEK